MFFKLIKNHKFIIQGVVILIISIVPVHVSASVVNVAPSIIDEKITKEESAVREISIENTANHRVDIYTSVIDTLPDGTINNAARPGGSDNEPYYSSLAGWISIPRNITLSPGEKKTITMKIDPSVRAEPGIYHAVLSFPYGGTRSQAEKKTDDASSVTVNLEILDDAVEAMALTSFAPDKIFFTGFPVSFNYSLENRGDLHLESKEEIRIYNRQGKEVEYSELSSSIEPGGKHLAENVTIERRNEAGSQFAQVANSLTAIDEFGRYKAILDIRYGKTRSIQDTAFFWVIPINMLVIIFLLFIGSFSLLGYAVHKKYERWHKKQLAHHLHKHGIASSDRPQHEPKKNSSEGGRTLMKDIH